MLLDSENKEFSSITQLFFWENIYSVHFTNVKGHINHYAKQREWPFTVPHMHQTSSSPLAIAIKKNAKYVNNKEMAKTKKNNGSMK